MRYKIYIICNEVTEKILKQLKIFSDESKETRTKLLCDLRPL